MLPLGVAFLHLQIQHGPYAEQGHHSSDHTSLPHMVGQSFQDHEQHSLCSSHVTIMTDTSLVGWGAHPGRYTPQSVDAIGGQNAHKHARTLSGPFSMSGFSPVHQVSLLLRRICLPLELVHQKPCNASAYVPPRHSEFPG